MLEFGRSWSDYGVWVLLVFGLLICVLRRSASTAEAL